MRIPLERGFFLTALLGISFFGLVIFLLSLFDTDYSPVSQVASDYGVGRFAIWMNAGFFIGGIGMCSLALGNSRLKSVRHSVAGSIILFIDGLVLVMDSYFTTNLEGAPATLHGTIHGFGGAIFFFTAPFGILLVAREFSRTKFVATLFALIIGVVFEITSAVLSLNAGGLGERILLLVIFGAVVEDAWALYRTSTPLTGGPRVSNPSQN